MAIAFLGVRIHSRSHGQSAVAGAAYRSGNKLFDERTGETHDFSNRCDVVFSDILLPEGADAAFASRAFLWNAVEAAEKRKDSQLAKDFILALPKELDLATQIELTRQFAVSFFVSKGLVADIAIHDHGDGNPHAHLYITTRRLVGRAFGPKARDLNPRFATGKHGRFVSEFDFWGEQWRDFQNRFFADHDLDVMVDENHLIAQQHEGRIRLKEDDEHYVKINNELKRSTALEIALTDPDHLLEVLSSRHAVFSERQLASLVFKCTQAAESFQQVFEQVMTQIKSHQEVICLGIGDDGRPRYTTRATFLNESSLQQQAIVLNRRFTHQVDQKLISKVVKQYSLSEEQLTALAHMTTSADLSAVVGRAGSGKSYLMRPAREIWQQAGFRVMGMAVSGIAAKNLSSGSGIHSTTIASFKMRLQQGSLELTNQDVLIMDEAGMTDLNDMAFIVYAVKQARAKLVVIGDPDQLQPIGAGAPFRVLIEQTGFAEMNQIRRQFDPADQQASQWLALGKVDKAFVHYQRKGAIHWHHTADVAMKRLVVHWAKQLKQDAVSDDFKSVDSEIHKQANIVANGSEQYRNNNTLIKQIQKELQNSLIIAHRNSDIQALNLLARNRLIELGYLKTLTHPKLNHNASPETQIISQPQDSQKTPRKLPDTPGIPVSIIRKQVASDGWQTIEVKDTIYLTPGDRILFRKNDKHLNVFNGELATIKKIDGELITVNMDKGTTLTFDAKQYQEFDYGYAATIHKTQGTTVDKVFVYAGGHGWNQHLAYVALTRHRKQVELHIDRETYASEHGFIQKLKTQQDKDSTLDWPIDFAKRRGFDFEALMLRLLEKFQVVKKSIKEAWQFLAERADKQVRKIEMKTNNLNLTKLKSDELKETHLKTTKPEKTDKNKKDSINEEWKRLATIKSPIIEQILDAKSRVDKATKSFEQDIYQNSFDHAVSALCSQEKLLSQVKTIAPTLAQSFEQMHQPRKKASIDWRANEFDEAFKSLAQSDNPQFQLFAKLRNQLHDNKDSSKEKLFMNQLESMAMDFARYPTTLTKINSIAPKLVDNIKSFAKAKSKERDVGRQL